MKNTIKLVCVLFISLAFVLAGLVCLYAAGEPIYLADEVVYDNSSGKIRSKYFSNKYLTAEIQWKGGEFIASDAQGNLLTGVIRRTADSVLLFEERYLAGRKNGVSRNFYNTGQPALERHFKNGRLEGPYEMYDETGRLTLKALFKNDILNTVEMFNASDTTLKAESKPDNMVASDKVYLVDGVSYDEKKVRHFLDKTSEVTTYLFKGRPVAQVEAVGDNWEAYTPKGQKLTGLLKGDIPDMRSEERYVLGKANGVSKYFYREPLKIEHSEKSSYLVLFQYNILYLLI